jgi:predicted small lipoprotein YifL
MKSVLILLMMLGGLAACGVDGAPVRPTAPFSAGGAAGQ